MKRIVCFVVIIFFIYLFGFSPLFSQPTTLPVTIKRLTHSGNNGVTYSSISADGAYVIYVLENRSGTDVQKTIRLLHIDSGKQIDLFVEGQTAVGKPYGEGPLRVGSKPPLLSADGQTAVFTLSLGIPDNILDHFLAVTRPGKEGIKVYRFLHQGVGERDMGSLDFKSPAWERISHYAISHDGNRIACVLKGHLGPRRFGDCSGIVLIDLDSSVQRFLLKPVFKDDAWNWSSFPRNPLLGGGWSFSLSGNGERVVFGAQSSQDDTDFDLYVADWEGNTARKITGFNDRWFSMAELDFKGDRVLFYYNGKKNRGIGTYRINTDGSDLQYMTSKIVDRIELYGVSGDGSVLFYKNVYQGLLMSVESGREYLLFDGQAPEITRGISYLDFPRSPAFWTPQTVSLKGQRLLLYGLPEGRQSPEIYLLSIEQLKIRQ